MSKNIPLIVDLDHTLINTDLLYESSIGALKQQPWLILIYPFWFFKGKGYLKSQLVKRFSIDVTSLPYIQATIDYINERKKMGDQVILATASHKDYAFAVAKHINLFDDVMASNSEFNLSSHNKAKNSLNALAIRVLIIWVIICVICQYGRHQICRFWSTLTTKLLKILLT